MKVIFLMNKNSLKSTIFKARTTFKVLVLEPQISKSKKIKLLRLSKKKLWKPKLLKCQLTSRLRSSSRKKERGALTLLDGSVMGELPPNLLKKMVKNRQKFKQSS